MSSIQPSIYIHTPQFKIHENLENETFPRDLAYIVCHFSFVVLVNRDARDVRRQIPILVRHSVSIAAPNANPMPKMSKQNQ